MCDVLGMFPVHVHRNLATASGTSHENEFFFCQILSDNVWRLLGHPVVFYSSIFTILTVLEKRLTDKQKTKV